MMYLKCAIFAALLQLSSSSFYIPGVSPQTYKQHESVKLFVTKLTSTKTQMPFDYYSLPYCKPSKLTLESENFGEIMSGDRIENSVYSLEAKVPEACQIACAVKLSNVEKDAFIRAIDEDYRVHWIVDNLPVGMYRTDELSRESIFTRGFPVGFKTGTGKKLRHYINNHVRIIIQYHDDAYDGSDETGTKIVGFRVEPMSIKHNWEGGGDVEPGVTVLSTCNAMNPAANDLSNFMSVDRTDTVVFTYDVKWEKSAVEWGNRWDAYIMASPTNEKVHWFSISNSIMVVLFLTVMIAMILIRALRKDIAQYNNPAAIEEAKEESGWKLIHGDVFRPPTTMPMLFSVLVGTGAQLFCMSSVLLTFALLGLLSPDNRGSIISAFILLFVFMGAFAGYYSALTYKMFRGTEWKNNTLLTACLYPGLVAIVVFVLNAALWMEGSSGAMAFSTFFQLLFLWFCVSVPLVFLGSYLGYKRDTPAFPVRTNQIPRAIPKQAWYMSPILTCMIGGVLPFGAVSVELFFIMSALWLHQIYYIFGFLFLVMIVLVATCAEVAVLICYFELCNEDYRWWWRSFLAPGACSVYIFLYAVWYNLTELEITEFIPLMLYFGYMSVMCLTAFLITGTIGYFSCFWFNHQIYSSIKVD